jgi:hypothetical protein
MDLSRKTVTYAVGDHRWLGSSHGTDMGQTITLDSALFTAGDHDANGFIPSGTVLGKVTATGLYGPYDLDAINGLETAVGHLLTDTPTGDGGLAQLQADSIDLGAALFTHGVVVEAFLPDFTTTDGEIDAAAKTDVGSRIQYR